MRIYTNYDIWNMSPWQNVM